MQRWWHSKPQALRPDEPEMRQAEGWQTTDTLLMWLCEIGQGHKTCTIGGTTRLGMTIVGAVSIFDPGRAVAAGTFVAASATVV
jgi:hypothetical protein